MENRRKYTINGIVSNLKKQPLQGITVRAFDLDSKKKESSLGRPAQTDIKGKYTIAYLEEDFRNSDRERGGADILIRVYDGARQELGKSEVYWDAKRSQTIHLSIDHEARAPHQLAYLIKPETLGKTALEIEDLPDEERLEIKRLLNEKLADTFLNMVGDQYAILEGILEKIELDYSFSPEDSLADFFKNFIEPEAIKQKISKKTFIK